MKEAQMMFDTVIRGGRVVTAEQGEFSADIGISEGKIAALLAPGASADTKTTIDASGRVVMPGAIDPHLHFCLVKKPIDDYDTETAAAAVGGVTTVIPYLLAQESYDKLYQETLDGAKQSAHVDYAFHYYINNDAQLAEIPHYIADHKVTSFKFYMPAREGEKTILGEVHVDDGTMYDLFSMVAKYKDTVVCVHCENIEVVWRLRDRIKASGRNDLAAWSDTRPPFVEAAAVRSMLFFAQQTGANVHVVHLGSGAGLDEVRTGKRSFPETRISAETCPAYLLFDKNAQQGNLLKVVPPMQNKEDNERLWQGLADGSIDCMGTDHSPSLRSMKQGTIWDARNNFTDVMVVLPIMISEGHCKRGLPLQRIVELTSQKPAQLFGLYPRKGTLNVGADADLNLIDLDWERTVKIEEFYTWADFSVYEGMKLRGWPRLTMVRGTVVQRDGKLVGPKGHGQYLARVAAAKA
jgi:Dihydroorotase and related cyclic amidohydrolases